MGIRQKLVNLIGGGEYRLGGMGLNQMLAPPTYNYQQYLNSYGQIGWLFRGASVIAQAVATESWHLYQMKKNGEQKEIEQHPLLEMLHKINNFQTLFELIYLQTLYMVLVGESFIVLDFPKVGAKSFRNPGQMWSAMPQLMTLKRDNPTDYISYYEYQAGGQPIRFELPEVLHIKNPNPLNPRRGIGAGQSLAADLSVERFSIRYQEKLFYNDAMPGLMLEFPDTPPQEERERLQEQWKQQHQGWGNARKTAFLWGGAKANTVTMTNRELDFWKSTQGRGDKILAVLGVPKIIAGIPEGTNRATAEVAKMIFAQYTVFPILIQFREAFNEQLLPLYPGSEEMRLDFSNPVPENREMKILEVEKMTKAGVMTREEGRQRIGLDPKPDKSGTFLNPQPGAFGAFRSVKIKMLFADEDAKEAHWKQWVRKAENHEKPIIAAFRAAFDKQIEEALGNLSSNTTVDTQLIDAKAAEGAYKAALEALLPKTLEEAIEDGLNLVAPKPGHRAIKQEPYSKEAAKWLETRIAWAAAEIGEETASLLGKALSAGFEAGESMDNIALRVKGVFDFCSDTRALRIARTETIMASSEGSLWGYGASEVVDEVEFYTALDERACDDCLAMHGEVALLKDAHGIIPIHPDCRCTWLPMV